MSIDENKRSQKAQNMPLKDMKKLPFTIYDDIPSDPDDEV